MRKATKKEEIAALEIMIGIMKEAGGYSADRYLTRLTRLSQQKGVQYQRLQGIYFPNIWQWEEYLTVLKLGWRRYFYSCNHKDSVFVKWYLWEKKVTNNCECCLYWRGVATGFLSATIIVSLFTLGKFLL